MALRQLVSNFTSAENRYVLENRTAGLVRDELDKLVSTYFLLPQQQDFLNGLGIQTDPSGASVHPHPVSATIERHLLTLVNGLRNEQPITVVSGKTGKGIRYFGRETSFVQPLLEPRDTYRYPDGTDNQCIDTPVAFLHDTLHYQNPTDILDLFDSNPNLQRVFASLIVPPEIVLGCTQHPNPAYSFEVRGDRLHYYPDSHYDAGYSQPLRCKDWLLYSRLSRGDTDLTLARVDSFASHHLMLFTRGSVPLHETRHIGLRGYDLVPTPTLTNPLQTTPVPSSTIEKMAGIILSAGAYNKPQLSVRARAYLREDGYPAQA